MYIDYMSNDMSIKESDGEKDMTLARQQQSPIRSTTIRGTGVPSQSEIIDVDAIDESFNVTQSNDGENIRRQQQQSLSPEVIVLESLPKKKSELATSVLAARSKTNKSGQRTSKSLDSASAAIGTNLSSGVTRMNQPGTGINIVGLSMGIGNSKRKAQPVAAVEQKINTAVPASIDKSTKLDGTCISEIWQAEDDITERRIVYQDSCSEENHKMSLRSSLRTVGSTTDAYSRVTDVEVMVYDEANETYSLEAVPLSNDNGKSTTSIAPDTEIERQDAQLESKSKKSQGDSYELFDSWIRVGPRFQAVVPPFQAEMVSDNNAASDHGVLLWDPKAVSETAGISNAAEFIETGKELNVRMALMESLCRCQNNIEAAKTDFVKVYNSTPYLSFSISKTDEKKIHKYFKNRWTERRSLKTACELFGWPPGMVMWQYYRWRGSKRALASKPRDNTEGEDASNVVTGNQGEVQCVCSTCNKVYQLHSLNPPLHSVPKGPWYCPSCIDIRTSQTPTAVPQAKAAVAQADTAIDHVSKKHKVIQTETEGRSMVVETTPTLQQQQQGIPKKDVLSAHKEFARRLRPVQSKEWRPNANNMVLKSEMNASSLVRYPASATGNTSRSSTVFTTSSVQRNKNGVTNHNVSTNTNITNNQVANADSLLSNEPIYTVDDADSESNRTEESEIIRRKEDSDADWSYKEESEDEMSTNRNGKVHAGTKRKSGSPTHKAELGQKETQQLPVAKPILHENAPSTSLNARPTFLPTGNTTQSKSRNLDRSVPNDTTSVNYEQGDASQVRTHPQYPTNYQQMHHAYHANSNTPLNSTPIHPPPYPPHYMYTNPGHHAFYNQFASHGYYPSHNTIQQWQQTQPSFATPFVVPRQQVSYINTTEQRISTDHATPRPAQRLEAQSIPKASVSSVKDKNSDKKTQQRDHIPNPNVPNIQQRDYIPNQNVPMIQHRDSRPNQNMPTQSPIRRKSVSIVPARVAAQEQAITPQVIATSPQVAKNAVNSKTLQHRTHIQGRHDSITNIAANGNSKNLQNVSNKQSRVDVTESPLQHSAPIRPAQIALQKQSKVDVAKSPLPYFVPIRPAQAAIQKQATTPQVQKQAESRQKTHNKHSTPKHVSATKPAVNANSKPIPQNATHAPNQTSPTKPAVNASNKPIPQNVIHAPNQTSATKPAVNISNKPIPQNVTHAPKQTIAATPPIVHSNAEQNLEVGSFDMTRRISDTTGFPYYDVVIPMTDDGLLLTVARNANDNIIINGYRSKKDGSKGPAELYQVFHSFYDEVISVNDTNCESWTIDDFKRYIVSNKSRAWFTLRMRKH